MNNLIFMNFCEKGGLFMFWDNFYQACLRKGTKPNPLAKELQIASGSMTAWKGGKLPNGETLLKIADYLGVSVDYLLGRTEEPQVINQYNNGDMFYERFVQLCARNNEKPTTVLKKIGVSSGNLNNWKNGTSVKSDILMQLSEHFNVSVDYLLGRTDEPQKINYGVENHGDNNGAINNQVNSTNTSDGISISDGISKEMLVKFEELNFTDKVKVMSLIAELSQKE